MITLPNAENSGPKPISVLSGHAIAEMVNPKTTFSESHVRIQDEPFLVSTYFQIGFKLVRGDLQIENCERIRVLI